MLHLIDFLCPFHTGHHPSPQSKHYGTDASSRAWVLYSYLSIRTFGLHSIPKYGTRPCWVLEGFGHRIYLLLIGGLRRSLCTHCLPGTNMASGSTSSHHTVMKPC